MAQTPNIETYKIKYIADSGRLIMDKEQAENKAQIRAWLLHLLADLEVFPDAEGHKTESAGNHIIIDIQLKS